MTSVLVVLIVLAGACSDAVAPPPAGGPGIPFGPFYLGPRYYGPPYTGMVLLDTTPSLILGELAAARAANERVVVRLARHRSYFQKADGSFSLTLWKREMDRFKGGDFSSYIADGTIIGHYLFDEPNDPSNWNGKPVPYGDVEAAAAYSKQLWPGMLTVIRAPPSWLTGWGQPWVALDAAWAQYSARFGDPATWIASESAAATRIAVGLLGGMNVLDGGDGSSGIRSPIDSGQWTMSPTELQRNARAILADGLVCGLLLWEWDTTYFTRPDIRGALSSIGTIARSHPAIPCR
ncbi:MAG TPA: hypothetical protein VFS44_03245 [Gemmatimonadaceae bacterium]|nr:hypothetical protein [Gemmatimonadaceae bacterium]